MNDWKQIAGALADVMAAGALDVEGLVERSARLLGKRWRWLRPLARRIHAFFGPGPRPRRDGLREFLLCDEGFRRAREKYDLVLVGTRLQRPEMCPAPGPPETWPVPAITTAGALAAWFEVDVRTLDWLADRFGFERKIASPRAQRYRYRLLSKGAGRFRVIESPKRRLKEVQRQILHGILDLVPPHDAAHAFRPGRSIATFVTPHAGRDAVLKMDLCDFFPSVPGARVSALFRTLGYPESVADLLAGLCTNSVPKDLWDQNQFPLHPPIDFRLRRLYERPHLPQGAPTSPAVANLCAYRLDRRLSALAQSAGVAYTRYADDLAFSGDGEFRRSVHTFRHHVASVVLEEGFRVNYHKTRIMRRSMRQSLAGVVVNQRPNVRRETYDRLKATLHNCIKHGPESQNRERRPEFAAHLAGQIAFVRSLNRQRGQRLLELYRAIRW